MPIDALRSVSDHFDQVLRAVRPRLLVAELSRADKAFYFRHFKGYRPEKIGRGRLTKVARKEIFEGDGHELLANLLIYHWNEANQALYDEMVQHVKTIDEDVEAIEKIEDDKAHDIIDDMLTRHDRVDVLLCTRLNGVRFSDEVIALRLEQGEPRPEPGAEAAAGQEEAEAAGDADSGSDETETEA